MGYAVGVMVMLEESGLDTILWVDGDSTPSGADGDSKEAAEERRECMEVHGISTRYPPLIIEAGVHGSVRCVADGNADRAVTADMRGAWLFKPQPGPG